MRMGLMVGMIVMLGACAPQEAALSGMEAGAGEGGKSIEDMRAEAWAKIDLEACESKGGVVRPEGMMGMPRCVTPSGDAGALCSDSSACEGRCLGRDGVTDYEAAPGEARGVCALDDSPFGCYAEIRYGTPEPMICVD